MKLDPGWTIFNTRQSISSSIASSLGETKGNSMDSVLGGTAIDGIDNLTIED